MSKLISRSKSSVGWWLIVIPTLAWCYIGLFLTMALWYPAGLPNNVWQDHLLHFSIIYFIWLIIFFSYRLFEWETLRISQTFFGRLITALVLCFIVAALYFYFQPALLITPRRFLLVHITITGVGVMLWYILMRRAASRRSRRDVYVHSGIVSTEEAQTLIHDHQFLGLQFAKVIEPNQINNFSSGSIIVIPSRNEINPEESRALFDLRSNGVSFVEYHELYERLTRTVHLSVLTDLWFIDSIDYGKHHLFDLIKRGIDILFSALGFVVFIISYPIFGSLIKLSSRGPVLFTQLRVGQNGEPFTLYKYRSMTTDSANNTWSSSAQSITAIGRFLRATRLDELPQTLNILKGDMSIVGPRPEQVGIVEQLRGQIPYYDERHIVKPGLTGWAQLHVYAASLEETKRKLQYDLYYIKHRSLLFDAEIIIKTVYNILSFAGR